MAKEMATMMIANAAGPGYLLSSSASPSSTSSSFVVLTGFGRFCSVHSWAVDVGPETSLVSSTGIPFCGGWL